jgi:hypothetical protein
MINPKMPQGLTQRQQNAWTDRARRMGADSANKMASRWNQPPPPPPGQTAASSPVTTQLSPPPSEPAAVSSPLTTQPLPATNAPALNFATDMLSQPAPQESYAPEAPTAPFGGGFQAQQAQMATGENVAPAMPTQPAYRPQGPWGQPRQQLGYQRRPLNWGRF